MKKSMVNVGVIGYGQWGPNHLRQFESFPDSRVLMCADLNAPRLKVMKETFPNVTATKDYKKILKNKRIDAVCIATPTATHYKFVKEALQHNKDVICEKPLALKTKECQEMIRLAKRKKRILMVGHVFLFNAGIQKLKQLLGKGALGAVQYAHSQRTNLGPFRNDVGALWDLAPHDICIFNYLFDSVPIDVSARGHRCLTGKRDDLAYFSLQYPNNVLVNVHVSWVDPRKVRSITIVGEKKMVCWDDLAMTGPVTLYDKCVKKDSLYYETFGEYQLLSKEGDVTIPKIDLWEPLKKQDAYFIECVQKRKNPNMADGVKGLEVVGVLDAVQKSIDNRGVPVRIKL